MKVWLVTIGEPVPADGKHVRLLRTGIFAHILAQNGHEVTWWNNRFDHSNKVMRDLPASSFLAKNLELRLIDSPGYQKNISFQRFYDHRELAKNFRELIAATGANSGEPDIIVASFPTMDLCNECILFGKKNRIPVLIDLRDLWPDTFVDVVPKIGQGIAKLLAGPLYEKARSVCKNATGIIGITQPFLDWGLKNAGRAQGISDKVVHFGYETAAFNGEPSEIVQQLPEKKDGTFVLTYIGNISANWDFRTIFEALQLLNAENGADFRFIVCGNGVSLDDYKTMSEGDEKIHFLGRVNARDIAEVMRISDVGMAPYLDIPNFQNTLSNKTIEYLSGKLPVLTSVSGYLGDFITQNEIGVRYKNGRPDELAEKLRLLKNDAGLRKIMAQNAIEIFQSRFVAQKVYLDYQAHLEQTIQNFKTAID